MLEKSVDPFLTWYNYQSFKIWTGLAGRPGPRTGLGETQSIFFLLSVIKRRRFDLLKGQNAEDS